MASAATLFHKDELLEQEGKSRSVDKAETVTF
jgi:hypothetical protein